MVNGALNDSLIIDRIISGVRSQECYKLLLHADYGEGDLTLEKAIEICRTCELTEQHMGTTPAQGAAASTVSTEPQVNAIGAQRFRGHGRSCGCRAASHGHGWFHGRGPPATAPQANQQTTQQYNQQANQQAPQTSHPQCTNCGRYHAKSQCSAKGLQCYACQGYNHFAAWCHKTGARGRSQGGYRNCYRGGYRGGFNRGSYNRGGYRAPAPQTTQSKQVHAVNEQAQQAYESYTDPND